ncbi:hypothetical protein R3P38DRAFT_3240734 [Favolaschia claudopus]|uniref:Uncharacterized protein n=1 Tax=Favolaschia claudopus TaxID=2862362 RepID=A0AAV9Z5V2_9AGAR
MPDMGRPNCRSSLMSTPYIDRQERSIHSGGAVSAVGSPPIEDIDEHANTGEGWRVWVPTLYGWGKGLMRERSSKELQNEDVGGNAAEEDENEVKGGRSNVDGNSSLEAVGGIADSKLKGSSNVEMKSLSGGYCRNGRPQVEVEVGPKPMGIKGDDGGGRSAASRRPSGVSTGPNRTSTPPLPTLLALPIELLHCLSKLHAPQLDSNNDAICAWRIRSGGATSLCLRRLGLATTAADAPSLLPQPTYLPLSSVFESRSRHVPWEPLPMPLPLLLRLAMPRRLSEAGSAAHVSPAIAESEA